MIHTEKFVQTEEIYFYDGSFEGFLSCVFACFVRKEYPMDIWKEGDVRTSFYQSRYIQTDLERAERVYKSLREKINHRAQKIVTTSFLSGEIGKEYLILRFLLLAYLIGGRVVDLIGDDNIAVVIDLEKAVNREAHHLKGFLRFEESNGMLGAVITPKHYVLPLLRAHFCARFPEEQFLIYDATHQAVLLYQDKQAEIITLSAPLVLPKPDEKESYYQALWRQFYASVEIKERHNELCRRTHCPKRYWSNMTELKGEL